MILATTPDSEVEMEGVLGPSPPPQPPTAVAEPHAQPAIQTPAQGLTNGAVKRKAQSDESEDGEDVDQPPTPPPDGNQGADPLDWPINIPGPIKGFDTSRILENLDPAVREEWEAQINEAVFIHYLDGGYTPTIAQNVHVIAEDLKSKNPQKAPPVIRPKIPDFDQASTRTSTGEQAK